MHIFAETVIQLIVHVIEYSPKNVCYLLPAHSDSFCRWSSKKYGSKVVQQKQTSIAGWLLPKLGLKFSTIKSQFFLKRFIAIEISNNIHGLPCKKTSNQSCVCIAFCPVKAFPPKSHWIFPIMCGGLKGARPKVTLASKKNFQLFLICCFIGLNKPIPNQSKTDGEISVRIIGSRKVISIS